MVLALAGALLGNLVAYSLGYEEISGFNPRSIAVTAAGIVVILVVYRGLRHVAGRRRAGSPDASM